MPKTALIVVDMQNDFFPPQPLGVQGAEAIVDPVNKLISQFDHVVLTQDWHPAQHCSFSETAPFTTIITNGREQELWPPHCIAGTKGADFHAELNTTKANLILRKGTQPELDSYSAFFANDHKTATGLEGYLKNCNITELFFCGLATDFCVGFSALDALACGFQVTVLLEACAAIDHNDSLKKMLNKLSQNGAILALKAAP